MPTKLNTEIVAAAIAGFEEQKKRLNAQIAELRQMLKPSAWQRTHASRTQDVCRGSR